MAGQIHDYPVLIDVTKRTLLMDFYAAVPGILQSVLQGDTLRLIIMGVRPHPQAASNPSMPWQYVELSTNLIAGIGLATEPPELGIFTLTYGGDTTTALAHDATAAAVQAALNLLASIVSAGGVTVTGEDGGPWRVVFNNPTDRTGISGNGDALYPDTSVAVYVNREGTVALAEIQTIVLERQPAAKCASFSALPSATVLVETLQEGSANAPDVQRVTLDPQPYGGAFTLTFGGKSTAAIPHDSTAAELQTLLEALSTIGAGNVTVSGAAPQWVVTFKGSLTGDQSEFTGDATGLLVPVGMTGLLNLSTEGILNLLGNQDRVTLKFEISEESLSKTILHEDVVVINDVIPSNPGAPRNLPEYLTEAETYQQFLPGMPCTALTGGGAGALDTLITADTLSAGVLRCAVVSGTLSIWQLQTNSGALAENAANGYVLPDDADPGLNNVIWVKLL